MDILNALVYEIENVEIHYNKHNGQVKKEQVLNLIDAVFKGNDDYEQIKKHLPEIIDMIIYLSKTGIAVNKHCKLQRWCNIF